MSILTRAAVTVLVVACADTLTFTPALFSARYRTPRRIAGSLVIPAALAAVPLGVVL